MINVLVRLSLGLFPNRGMVAYTTSLHINILWKFNLDLILLCLIERLCSKEVSVGKTWKVKLFYYHNSNFHLWWFIHTPPRVLDNEKLAPTFSSLQVPLHPLVYISIFLKRITVKGLFDKI